MESKKNEEEEGFENVDRQSNQKEYKYYKTKLMKSDFKYERWNHEAPCIIQRINPTALYQLVEIFLFYNC